MNKKFELEYNNKKVEYVIIKSRVKNIYIKIKNNFVEVKVPNNVTIGYIDKLIDSKKEWIFKSLEKQRVHEDRHIDIKNKDYIYILDNKIKVEYYFKDVNRINIDLSDKYCRVYIPNDIKNNKELLSIIEKKLEMEEKKLAETRIDMAMEKYILLTGISPKSYKVGKYKSMWGNCSSKREIKINQNVIWYSQREIEYVCLHEICHLRYMNHKKEFWNMVEKYMPNYKESVKKLKE